MSPQGNGFESAGVFNPAVVKRGNQFIMLYRAQDKKGTSRVGYATSSDGVQFIRRADPVMEPATEYERDGGLEDPRLIKMVYNGADDRTVYATGWVLFDKNDPTKVLARSEKPIFSVEQEWEKIGQVPNVVFVSAMVRDGHRWLFYYGGADKYVGVAGAPTR